MKVAIVTGSSSGIGKAISKALLQEEYKIYGISRTKPSISSHNFIWIKADLTNPKEYLKISKGIKEKQIDLLVNNAGIVFEEKAFDFIQKSFERMYNINYRAPILLTQLLKKKLGGGLVINISSVSDRLIGENYGLYCSSKAALNIFFDVAALEEKNIRFISILPSYVDTKLLRKLQNKRNFDWGVTLRPEQIAEFAIKIVKSNDIPTGSKIIIVNDSLREDLHYKENVWGYNATTKQLFKLKQFQGT